MLTINSRPGKAGEPVCLAAEATVQTGSRRLSHSQQLNIYTFIPQVIHSDTLDVLCFSLNTL